MTAQELIQVLLSAEIDPNLASDCRRVMRDTRLELQAALQMTTRPPSVPNDPRGRYLASQGLVEGPGVNLARRMREAESTARAWGII